MNSNADIIKKPLLSDKTISLISNNQYTFLVNGKSNKTEIKATIESLFGVKVRKVNTIQQPIKKKRFGSSTGLKTRFKKAIVKLQPGQKIKIFSEE